MPAITTALVGVTNRAMPAPQLQPVTTSGRDTSAKSPSGASSGISRVAWPDDEGMMNAMPVLMMKTRPTNPTADVPLTAFSIQLRIVSIVCVLFRITVTPRASTTATPAPMKSPKPRAMFPVICFSLNPATRPTTTEATRNSAISSGNHHPRFHHGSFGNGTCVERIDPLLEVEDRVPRDHREDEQRERERRDRED